MTKIFEVPQDLAEDFANTINTVKNNIGSLNYQIVPISAIEFDPQNPRELKITREDLLNGLKPNDSFYEVKLKELESLQQMAETIKKHGVRNAVEIYAFGTKYRLIHGERRCLSSILAGKTEIPAKVLSNIPSDLDIRLLQFIENAQRENLSLYESLNNIKIIIQEYKNHIDSNITLNASFLEQTIHKSKSQCFNLLAVLNAPEEIQLCIKEGKIKNLEKAAVIASAKDESQQRILLNACLNGASLNHLKQINKQQKTFLPASNILRRDKSKPGKKSSKINLGETKNKKVIQKIVSSVIEDPRYNHFADSFKQFTYDSFDSCSMAFKKLITMMEKMEAL